jgi:FtsP/CotA-like multicopper oxidase with cupredoxin domain
MMMPLPSQLDRRRVLAGLAAVAALQATRRTQAADASPAVTIKQGPAGAIFDPAFPANPGNRLWLNLTNALAVPVTLGTLGLDGVPALQPLSKPLLEPGQARLIDRSLASSGTFVFEAKSIDDSAGRPRAIAAFTVAESSPPQVDQDLTLLIEEVFSDGTASTSADAQAGYTVNGQSGFTVQLGNNERARLRLINGSPRKAIGLRFDEQDLRVIAIDSRPAEPFLARDRRIALAPGSRVDALVEATAPARSTSPVRLFDGGVPRQIGQLTYTDAPPLRAQPLPEPAPLPDAQSRLELASALRMQLDLDGPDWLSSKDFVADRRSPLFRTKLGRTVLLTLTNRATLPTTFHMYGHHFRWLDRLDDGWKPFTPDTMLVDVGQTERIAFRADFPGDWLIENTPMSWSAPKRVHWFAVE